MQQRDADATRARILETAVREFARVGLAGARVDAIARNASVSVRMIYHYFGSKEGLYQAVIQEHAGRRGGSLSTDRRLEDLLRTHVDQFQGDEDFVRLVQWDSLSAREGGGGVGIGGERGRRYREIVGRLVQEQGEGRLDPDLDPDLVMMLVVAVTTFPFAFPDIAERILDEDVHGEQFLARFRAFLDRLAILLGAGD